MSGKELKLSVFIAEYPADTSLDIVPGMPITLSQAPEALALCPASPDKKQDELANIRFVARALFSSGTCLLPQHEHLLEKPE